MTRDDENYLHLLSIFHYVLGGLVGLFALIPTVHLTFGLLMAFGSLASVGNMEGFFMSLLGGFFALLATVLILLVWACAVSMILTGRYIAQRRNHLFCLAVAGVECALFPIGTVLGVFTFILLLREPIKQAFDGVESSAPTAPAA